MIFNQTKDFGMSIMAVATSFLLPAALVACGSGAASGPGASDHDGGSTDGLTDGGLRDSGSVDDAKPSSTPDASDGGTDGGANVWGTYEVTHHTLNMGNCVQEGPDVTPATTVPDGQGKYFYLWEDNGLGSPVVAFSWCDSVQDCPNSPSLGAIITWTVAENTLSIDESMTAGTSAFCSMNFYDTTYTKVADNPLKLHLQRVMKHAQEEGDFSAPSKCDDLAVSYPDDKKQCGYISVLEGRRVQP